MKDHPFNLLNAGTPPPVEELEAKGRTWQQASVSDEYLVGFVTRSWGTDVANQTPAVIEMQRRLMVEIKKVNRASTVLGWHRDLRGLSAARSRRVSVVDRVHAWET
jgi:hypothetical protein